MRDANGNEITGKALKDDHGHPIVPVGLSPQEPGTVEALRSAKVEIEDLKAAMDVLMKHNEELHTVHNDTAKDLGILSDSHAELQIQHEKLLEAHIAALEQIAAEEEKCAPANLVVMPTPELGTVEATMEQQSESPEMKALIENGTTVVHVPIPEEDGEPFPLEPVS